MLPNTTGYSETLDQVLHKHAWENELKLNTHRGIFWMTIGTVTLLVYGLTGREIPWMAHISLLWGSGTLLFGQGTMRRQYSSLMSFLIVCLDLTVLLVVKDDLYRSFSSLSPIVSSHELFGTSALILLVLGTNVMRVSWIVSLGSFLYASLGYLLLLKKNGHLDSSCLLDLLAFFCLTSFVIFFNNQRRILVQQAKERESFSRFLPGPIVERLTENPFELRLGGEIQEVTILFADIRDFTKMSEPLAPEAVVQFLNEYFTQMVDEIFQHNGILDKFMGDGICAVFGPPILNADQASLAIRCGAKMFGRLNAINLDREGRGETALAIGIGIHTGLVIAGNIGSPRRMEYTHIGDAVNVTSRVEGLCKSLGRDLLVTQEAIDKAGGLDAIPAEAMTPIHVKGKPDPIQVYAVDIQKLLSEPTRTE